MSKGLWSEVQKAVAAGQVPVVRLPKAAKVIIPKRPPGRPRKRPVGAHGHYGWTMTEARGSALRCRNPGCRKYVRKNAETITCSESCRAEYENFCRTTLAVLTGEMRALDYPREFLRRQRTKGGGH